MTATAAPNLLAARYYASRGWASFPIHGIVDGRCTCGDPQCGQPGKHPATPHGHKDASTDAERLRTFFDNDLTRNIAIATGVDSGLLVVDVDPRNGGDEAWDEFEAMFPEAEFPTHTVASGGGGLHFYYRLSDPTPTIIGVLRGVDLKAQGGYVIAPPSSHISGGRYATAQARDELAPIPSPLVEMIRSGARPAGLKRSAPGAITVGLTTQRQQEIFANPAELGPGERDTFFTFTARDLRRGGKPIEEAVTILGGIYERMANPPDDPFTPELLIRKIQRAYQDVDVELTPEARATVDHLTLSAARAQPGTDLELAPTPTPTPAAPDPLHLPPEIFAGWDGTKPPDFAPNDDTMARLAAIQWRHRIRYDRDLDDWLVYEPEAGHWIPRATPEVTELVKWTIRSVDRVIAMAEDDMVERAAFRALASKYLNSPRVTAVLKSLSTLPEITIYHDELDNNPGVLPVENGVICPDPSSFGYSYNDVPFRPHRPEDLFTAQARLRHDSHATAPFWERAVEAWFPNPEYREYARRLMGYAVFGRGQEKVFVVAHGERDSGKSAFFNNVRDLLGAFAQDIDADSLIKQRGFRDHARYDLAHIAGARFLLASETAVGAAWDEALIKKLASGGDDVVRARLMRENFLSIRNRGLLVIMTNRLPQNTGLDAALQSRLLVLPFLACFDRNDPNTLRPEQLKALFWQERDGILRWFVEGYSDYTALGLRPPTSLDEENERIRQEQDWLGAYIEERVELAPPQAKEKIAAVTEDYFAWCRATGDEPEDQRIFRAAFGERFKRGRSTGGVHYYFGVRLRYGSPGANLTLPASWE